MREKKQSKKENQLDKDIDPRIKNQFNYWRIFRIVFFILAILATAQGLIYNSFIGNSRIPFYYFLSMIGFWALVTLVFISVVLYQKKRFFDNPIKLLSQAAKKVAEGDFTVYVEPRHKKNEYDYVDVLYQDFNKMVEELGTIQSLKNDVIGNVSHEMKTPLSVIQSYAIALQKENLSPDHAQNYIETIVEATKKLDSLITNVLQLNKLENQEIILDIEPIDFSRHLTEAILRYERLIDQKKIELDIRLEEHVFISSNSGMLDLVWNNILSNAVKFSNPNGKISITQTSDKDNVYFQFTDTGCGMSEDTLNNLFDKFYQGDSSHSAEGNGLGMALVLRVVNLLNGKITVNSKLAEGTSIRGELPK